jgi:hypothetical protein
MNKETCLFMHSGHMLGFWGQKLSSVGTDTVRRYFDCKYMSRGIHPGSLLDKVKGIQLHLF